MICVLIYMEGCKHYTFWTHCMSHATKHLRTSILYDAIKIMCEGSDQLDAATLIGSITGDLQTAAEGTIHQNQKFHVRNTFTFRWLHGCIGEVIKGQFHTHWLLCLTVQQLRIVFFLSDAADVTFAEWDYDFKKSLVFNPLQWLFQVNTGCFLTFFVSCATLWWPDNDCEVIRVQ